MIMINPYQFIQVGGNTTLKNGLVSCWQLDEASGSIAFDSHNSNHGTIYNALVNQAGPSANLPKSISFDGDADYIIVPHNANLAVVGDISISAWVKIPDKVGYKGIISKTASNQPKPFDFWIQPTTGYPHFFMGNGVGNDYSRYAGSWTMNSWVHLVVTRVGPTVRFYLNGTLVATDNGFTPPTPTDNGSNLYIGNRVDSATDMKGNLAQVCLYNRVLIQSEITTMHNSGNGLPYSAW